MSNELEINDQFEYIGWVPCISGNLYFEKTTCDDIGTTGYSNINFVEELPNSTLTRFIVIASHVDWKDYSTTADGNWKVVMMTSGLFDADHIKGRIYLISEQTNIWQRIAQRLRSLAHLEHKKESIALPYTQLKSELDNQLGIDGVYSADFKLTRLGFIFLRAVSTQNIKNKETAFIVCRQSFYFAKYSFHKHKHHSPSESLTTIHPYTVPNDKTGKALINDLKMALVSLKRDADPSSYKSLFAAKGILSYAKSLAISCKSDGYLSDSVYLAEKSYIDNIGESLEIAGKRIEGELTVRAQFNSNFRSIGLFLFALIAPFTLIFKDEIIKNVSVKPVHIIDVLTWFMKDELHILIVFVFFSGIYFSWKWLHLKYGSPNLAFRKYTKLGLKTLEFVLDDPVRAVKLLYFGYFLFGICLISLLLRLF